MKSFKVLRFILALVLVLSLCACDTEISDTDTSADTQAETEKEPEITVDKAEVTFTSFKVDGESFKATIISDVDFNGTVNMEFKKDGDSYLVSSGVEMKKGEECEISGERIPLLSANFSLSVEAYCSSKLVDSYTLKFNRGTIQISERSIDLVLSEMTLEEKAHMVLGWGATNNIAARTYGIRRFGIYPVMLADGPAGLRVSSPTICYPSGTNLASTWNVDTVQTVTECLGNDLLQYGADVLLAPGMNIQKNVLCGRNFEYFSEDPLLTGMMAANYTTGVQSNGIGVALKHYAANNQETDRGAVSADVTERALREIYLRAFDYAVELGHPYCVMTSYNRINGIHTAANEDLVEKILRGEFGFDGTVMSDWGASGGRIGMINAGNDLFCGGANNDADAAAIIDFVNKGELEVSALDYCCKNVLKLVVRSNAKPADAEAGRIENKAEKREEARKAGAEGMVLLKNEENTLPIKTGNIAFFGSGSYNTAGGGGGSGSVYIEDIVNITEAFSELDGITLNEDVAKLYPGLDQPKITKEIAKQAALNSDIAVFTIVRLATEGTDHTDTEGEFRLTSAEKESIINISEQFHAQGKKLIVLLNIGNPIETVSWRDYADSILLVGLAGEQIGNSVADVMTGKVNPSGKLTCSWPVSYSDAVDFEYFGSTQNVLYYEDIYVGYRYYTTFDVDVAYEFGYGLSYTAFEYSDFAVTNENGEHTLSVKVKNTGNTAGSEAVQFYVTKPDGKNEHPVIELAGFDKTDVLEPGKEQIIAVKVTNNELMTYYTQDSQWIVEKGEYTFHVGASVEDIKFTSNVTLEEEILVLDTENMCEPAKELEVLTKK